MGIALKKTCKLTTKEIESFGMVPYPGRVVVKEAEISSAGIIAIPKDSKEVVANEGLVIACGDGIDFCQVGDRIYYAKYSGFNIERDGAPFRIMNEEDILGRGESIYIEEDKSWNLM